MRETVRKQQGDALVEGSGREKRRVKGTGDELSSEKGADAVCSAALTSDLSLYFLELCSRDR